MFPSILQNQNIMHLHQPLTLIQTWIVSSEYVIKLTVFSMSHSRDIIRHFF